jgi:hypothetical protein
VRVELTPDEWEWFKRFSRRSGPVPGLELPRFRGEVSAWFSSVLWDSNSMVSRGRSRVRVAPFEVDRGDAAERRMAAPRVVPAFDIREERYTSFGLTAEAASVDELALEAGEEALGPVRSFVCEAYHVA